MRRLMILSLFLVVSSLLLSNQAWGDGTPANLHIGTGVGTPCQSGCAGEPNIITNTLLDIAFIPGNSVTITNPLLILAVPNDTSAFNTGTVLTVNFFPGPVAGSATFLSTHTGFGPGDDIYTFLGLAGNNSNSFTNFTQHCNGCTSADLNATSFTIYVFQLNGTLSAGGFANVAFGTPLPNGTLAFAWGVGSDGKSYGVPWTEAGGAVPEPGSMALLGSGLIGLAGLLRRKLG